ncbi:MAG TPA: SGNH/GDSL hydrolase family protein [Elusimicrobiota bacterium]|nr:SGNH/GDSL hydrolase family protein [Elusimicrobiota bacterium]
MPLLKKYVSAAALLLSGVLAAAALAESSLRLVDTRLHRDILREYDARIIYRRTQSYFSDRPSSPEGSRFVFVSPRLPLRYSAGAIETAGGPLRYRKNGLLDDAPVHGVVLGDSYSENLYLDDSEGWVSLLSQATRKRFLNLARTGTGTEHHLRCAELILPVARADVVLLQICFNDVLDDNRRADRTHPSHPRAGLFPRPDRLRRVVAETFPFNRSVFCFMFARWGMEFIGTRFFSPPLTPPIPETYPPDELARTTNNIAAIKGLSERHGAHLIVIAFADDHFLETLGLPAWSQTHHVPLVVLNRSSSLWQDVPPSADFSAHLFLTNPHFNELGNRKIAAHLQRVLQEKPSADAVQLPRDSGIPG